MINRAYLDVTSELLGFVATVLPKTYRVVGSSASCGGVVRLLLESELIPDGVTALQFIIKTTSNQQTFTILPREFSSIREVKRA